MAYHKDFPQAGGSIAGSFAPQIAHEPEGGRDCGFGFSAGKANKRELGGDADTVGNHQTMGL